MPALHSTTLCMHDMSEKTSSPQKEKYLKMPQAESKGLKRKLLIPASPTEEHDGEKRSTSKRKRNSLTLETSPEPSNNASPRNSSNPSRTVPLSERQQMAMLMRLGEMTQGDASPKPTSPTSTVPSARKTPADKDKNKTHKRNDRGETQLHQAAKKGDLKQTKKLIRAGADVNVHDYAGWTPLHEACNHGNLQVAKQLLKAGSNVNVQGLGNITPLHDAASNNHIDVVELLLKHGANPLQVNTKGQSALEVTDSEEIRRVLRKEIIASSCSESSSIDEDRSPNSPASVSSLVQDGHLQDSNEADLLPTPEGKQPKAGGKMEEISTGPGSCLSSGPRRSLLERETDKTNASPRLYLKLSSNKATRDSKDPQLRSYILLPGGKKESPLGMSSPVSSVDSDQFQEHFLPARQALQREDEEDEDMEVEQDVDVSHSRHGLHGRMTDSSVDVLHKDGRLGEEVEATSSQNYSKAHGKFSMSSHGEYASDAYPSFGKTFTAKSQAAGVGGSTGESQHIPDQSDANHHRQPLTFSSSQAASTSTSSAFRDCGAPDSTNSSSSLAYQYGSSSGSSSTGTNGHTGALPSISSSSSSSLSPSSSAHVHRMGRTSPYHQPQAKQPRLLGPVSNGPTGPECSQSHHGPSPTTRWDSKETRSGSWGGDEEDVSVSVASHRERTDSGGSTSISPRTDRLSRESQRGGEGSNGKDDGVSPRSELGSRPCSPKVPPLKIVLSTKSSPANSSSEPDSLKAPTKLYHVLNPTQEQGERAVKEEGEELTEGETNRLPLQPPLTRLMASQNSTQAAMSPGPSRPSSRASQGDAEENKTKPQPASSSSATSVTTSTATTASCSVSSSSTSAAQEDLGKEECSSDKALDKEDKSSCEESEGAEKDKPDGEKEKAADAKEAGKTKEDAKEEKEERRSTRTLRSHTAQLAQQQKLERQEKERQEKLEKAAANHEAVPPLEAGCSASPKGEEGEEFDSIHPRKRKLRPKTEAQAVTLEPPHLPPMPEKPPNPYQEYLDMRKKVAAKQSAMVVAHPKLPEAFNSYTMVTCNYMIQGNNARLSVPMLSPPNSVTGPMVQVFRQQEKERYDLRCKHLIELDKLRLLMEEETVREHTKAARALANQPVPFSFCSILRDQEIYNPEFERGEERTVRTRYTQRQLLLWLQDVKDKFGKMKQLTAHRQHQEAESLYMLQRMNWEWKLKELGQCDRLTKPQIDDLQVPMVEVRDNFDLPN